MLNRSADYALRAVLYLAQREAGATCKSGEIAEAIGVPRNYLGKVLRALTYARVVHSERGPAGGFRLAVSPAELTLADVTEPFQRLPERRMCLQGNRPCDAADPCSSHRQWQAMTDQVRGFFRVTTIATLLDGDAAGHGSAVPAASLPGASATESTPEVRRAS